MATDFFRVERGFEIDAADGSTLIQIITDTAAPDVQTDAVNATIGSLWIVRNGVSSRLYQKFSTASSNHFDWRDITGTISWREPVRATDTDTWATVAAATTQLNSGTPNTLGGVDVANFVDGDRILFTDFTTGTENVYIVSGTQPTATLVEDQNAASDGDAVFTQQGTFADVAFMYNGTVWVQFGSGSAAEEGFIRAFVGKNAAGPETPNYAAPSSGGGGDEAPNNTPFTDATSANGYVVNDTDNLELAIAKINQELFQNNRHLYATGVTTLVDTCPTWVDGVKWIARVQQGTSVRAAEIHATTDGTNVTSNTASILAIGAAITGLSVVVTVSGGALVLTVNTTASATFEIRRLGTVGVPTTVGRGLHV